MILGYDNQALRDDTLFLVRLRNVLVTTFTRTLTRILFLSTQNTQSGSQWDGLRHFGILEHGMYYNKYEDPHTPFVPSSLTLDAVCKLPRSRWDR